MNLLQRSNKPIQTLINRFNILNNNNTNRFINRMQQQQQQLPQSQLSQSYTSAAAAVSASIQSSVHNGIMSQDSYYLNGLPPAKYQLINNNTTNTNTTNNTTADHLYSIFAAHSHIDPFTTVSDDLRTISASIKEVIGSDHSVLSAIAKYFFEVNGKRIRPTIVLLMARALLNSTNTNTTNSNNTSNNNNTIIPSQYRLSEISEMIHTASLLHDDVIDESATRRGIASINAKYGNKFAVLGGDFLLSRASVALARLRDPDVIELLSQVLEHLVKGEMMQLKPAVNKSSSSTSSNSNNNNTTIPIDNPLLTHYVTKTYYKTASLIANSCKAVAILGGHSVESQSIAYEYGKNIGLTFQIIDDILDLSGNTSILGKPTKADLTSGLATAPVLYAAIEFPELNPLIQRKFCESGDIALTMDLLTKSNAMKLARELAESCAASAVAAIMQLQPSQAQSALIQLVQHVLNREK